MEIMPWEKGRGGGKYRMWGIRKQKHKLESFQFFVGEEVY